LSTKQPYSAEFRPPAPVLALRAGVPGREPALGLMALVDTGADLSVLPQSVVAALGLPQVSTTRIQGVTGVAESTPVHAATLEVAGTRALAEVVAWGDEAIVGRDILARFVLELDGPRETLTVRVATPAPAPAPRRRLKRVR
jgi:predicted aspartyl protease